MRPARSAESVNNTNSNTDYSPQQSERSEATRQDHNRPQQNEVLKLEPITLQEEQPVDETTETSDDRHPTTAATTFPLEKVVHP